MKNINIAATHLQLSQAKLELDQILSVLASRPEEIGDSYLFSIRMKRIQGHLNLAWHLGQMTDEDASKLPQDKFDMLHDTPVVFGK